VKRRELLQKAAAAGLLAAAPASAKSPAASATPGAVPVAFLLSEGAVVIDFCGPWEVFQDVQIPGRADAAFQLYTVAETKDPIHTSGGMKLLPDYDFKSAPAPKVIVIPAQGGQGAAALDWIRKSSKGADLTMSVCTGAFLLAKTGLLAGRPATTHHGSYKTFAMEFPDVHLRRGARFVEDGNVASAGGLTSGIDLALRVVERYYGRDAAQRTAWYMEYQGQGWLDAASNAPYATAPQPAAGHALCPVCWMEVDPASAPRSDYRGKSYFFCMPEHKQRFDRSPEGFL